MNSQPDETDVVRRLFLEHVPNIAAGVVQILGIARESGSRSVLAVTSRDPGVDAVGACVGHRGDRVKRVVSALGGELIDIVLWSEPAERFIANLLAPARPVRVTFDDASHQATVLLPCGAERPAPIRLALQSKLLAELTGWELKLVPENNG